MANGHGGKREGAGRPRGSISDRVAYVMDHLSIEENNPIIMLTEAAQKARETEDWHLLYKVGNSLVNYCIPKVKPQDENIEDQARPINVSVNFPLPGTHWRTGKPVPQDVQDYLNGNYDDNPEARAIIEKKYLHAKPEIDCEDSYIEPAEAFVEDADPYSN